MKFPIMYVKAKRHILLHFTEYLIISRDFIDTFPPEKVYVINHINVLTEIM